MISVSVRFWNIGPVRFSVFRLIVKTLYSTDFSGTPWLILIDYFSSVWFSVYHDFSGTLNRLWWKISIWPFIFKNARLCRFWKSIDLNIKVVVIILWKYRENVGSWKETFFNNFQTVWDISSFCSLLYFLTQWNTLKIMVILRFFSRHHSRASP